MNPENNQEKKPIDPLERAKALINEKKKERLSSEEIENANKEEKFNEVYDRYQKIVEEFSDVELDLKNKPKEHDELQTKKSNLQRGQNLAMEALKNDPDTKKLFEEGGENIEEDHAERREIFDSVFKESQNEKRALKKGLGENKQEKIELSEKQTELIDEVKEIFSDEEMKNELINKILKEKDDLRKHEDRDSGSYYKKNSIERVNKYFEDNKEDIDKLSKNTTEVFTEIIDDFNSKMEEVKNSDEYKKLFKGEDFDIQELIDMAPKSAEELEVSMYDTTSHEFKLGQFKEIEEKLVGVINDFSNKATENEAIFQNSPRGFFGGESKKQKEHRNLADMYSSKRKFLLEKVKPNVSSISTLAGNTRNSQHEEIVEEYKSVLYDLRYVVSGRNSEVLPEDSKYFPLIKFLNEGGKGFKTEIEDEIAAKKYEEILKKIQKNDKELGLLEVVEQRKFRN